MGQVSSGADHTLRAWNVADWTCAVLLQHDATVMGCAFSPDGKILASVQRHLSPVGGGGGGAVVVAAFESCRADPHINV